VRAGSANVNLGTFDDSREVKRTRTPHSGFHWDGSSRTFFEGWYFKITIPDRPGCSFAFIYAVEDPAGDTARSASSCQVMGPSDGYIVQWQPTVSDFWGSRHALELGYTFETRPGQRAPRGLMPEERWAEAVERGWQTSPRLNTGSIVATDAPGSLGSTVRKCRWSYTTTPLYGWGESGEGRQRSTAGWLAALPVFEPHWQICMGHGLATGWVEWGDERIEFQNAPAYAEKNWGGQFPEKWFWAQCNAFEGQPTLAVTAGGGRRGLLGVPGVKEDVAMVGVHHEGRFYNVSPEQDGAVVWWRVSPWGFWEMRGTNRDVEVTLTSTCAARAGTLLRAPTADQGMVPFCKDTFAGEMTLRVRRMDGPGGAPGTVVVEATSRDAALEVGGGPWWETWESQAVMREPLKSLLQLPVERVAGPVVQAAPWPVKPPGL